MTDQSDATQADAATQSQADTTHDATQADAEETISLDEARKMRAEAQSLRKRLKDAETKAQAAEENDRKARDAKAKEQGEWEKIAKDREAELEAIKADLAARDLNDRKTAIAKAAGLPDDLATRLQGETDEELEADAKGMAKLLRVQEAPENDAGERTPKGTKKPDKNAWSDPAKWGLRQRPA